MDEERGVDLDDLLPDLGLADVMRQRPAGIGSVRHAVRIAIAVTLSWMIALAISHSAFSLFAPVTTLLVVQTSPWSTLGISIQRILGTGVGVLVASIYVNLVGLSWWSFLLGVLVALLVARVIPWSLGGQLQIPVAVVFVLALGPGTIQQDAWRVADVAIGGAVGLIAVFVFPQRPRPTAFEAAMRAYRSAVIDTMQRVAAETGAEAHPLPVGAEHGFVAPSRRLRAYADDARAALVELAEGSHLNLRAGTVPDELEDCALRLRRMGGIGVQVRGVVGAVNRMYDRADIAPGLSADSFRALMGEVVSLMESVLGTGDTDVGATSRDGVRAADVRLADRIRAEADTIAAPGVGDVLQSVSLLGRLDHIRGQVIEFPMGRS